MWLKRHIHDQTWLTWHICWSNTFNSLTLAHIQSNYKFVPRPRNGRTNNFRSCVILSKKNKIEICCWSAINLAILNQHVSWSMVWAKWFLDFLKFIQRDCREQVSDDIWASACRGRHLSHVLLKKMPSTRFWLKTCRKISTKIRSFWHRAILVS